LETLARSTGFTVRALNAYDALHPPPLPHRNHHPLHAMNCHQKVKEEFDAKIQELQDAVDEDDEDKWDGAAEKRKAHADSTDPYEKVSEKAREREKERKREREKERERERENVRSGFWRSPALIGLAGWLGFSGCCLGC